LNPIIDSVNVTLEGLVWPEVGSEWIQETFNRMAGLFKDIKALEIHDGFAFMQKEIVDIPHYIRNKIEALSFFTGLKEAGSWPYDYYHDQGDLQYMLDRPYAS